MSMVVAFIFPVPNRNVVIKECVYANNNMQKLGIIIRPVCPSRSVQGGVYHVKYQ